MSKFSESFGLKSNDESAPPPKPAAAPTEQPEVKPMPEEKKEVLRVKKTTGSPQFSKEQRSGSTPKGSAKPPVGGKEKTPAANTTTEVKTDEPLAWFFRIIGLG